MSHVNQQNSGMSHYRKKEVGCPTSTKKIVGHPTLAKKKAGCPTTWNDYSPNYISIFVNMLSFPVWSQHNEIAKWDISNSLCLYSQTVAKMLSCQNKRPCKQVQTTHIIPKRKFLMLAVSSATSAIFNSKMNFPSTLSCCFMSCSQAVKETVKMTKISAWVNRCKQPLRAQNGNFGLRFFYKR